MTRANKVNGVNIDFIWALLHQRPCLQTKAFSILNRKHFCAFHLQEFIKTGVNCIQNF